MKKAKTSDKKIAKKVPPQSPKGMQDLIGEDFYAYQGFMEKAAEICSYYGIKPIETPIMEEAELFTSSVGEGTDIVEKEMYFAKATGSKSQLALRPENTAGVMRAYIEHGMQSWPQPVMFYYFGPYFRHEKPQKGRLREFKQFGIEILGSPKSVADAMVIKLTATILEEAGFKDLVIDINSIGDKECRNSYKRELVNYYKKHLNTLCKDCKIRIKNNPLRLLDCKDEKCQPIKENAPQSVSYLCGSCKSHFKEVLEYLEKMKIEYRINSNLVRGLDYYTRTVFEILTRKTSPVIAESTTETKSEESPKESSVEVETENVPIEKNQPLALAGGGRYDYLARGLGNKKDIPGVGVAIGVDRIVASEEYSKLSPRIIKKPKVYFIQLGFEAKLQSMAIIEILRKAKIPVIHSLGKDKLSSQLAIAEKLQIPYSIILGQREVLDQTVIVRNMENRSQDTVKFDKLAEYVKKLK